MWPPPPPLNPGFGESILSLLEAIVNCTPRGVSQEQLWAFRPGFCTQIGERSRSLTRTLSSSARPAWTFTG